MSGPAASHRFILAMAAREMRASWKRLLFFFLCLAVGVGAIVALRSVIQSVRAALAAEARTLMAADLVIESNRPWSDRALARIDARLAAAPVRARTHALETTTMIRPADPDRPGARMVELRGVEGAFPLYGTVVLGSGQPYAHALLQARGALVRPELLAQLDLAVGDRVVIGTHTFTIRDVILIEPGRRLGAFALGSPVLIDHEDLLETGLVTVGSRATRGIAVQVDEPALEALAQGLEQDLRNEFVRVRSFRHAEDRIGTNLQRAEDYLSLVGFVILVLGGIGVWSVTRVFIGQKLRSVAILKCLGARTREVLAVYVTQMLALGLAGSLLGIALAAIGIRWIPPLRIAHLTGIEYGVTASAALQGLGVGVIVALLFSLAPLLEVRRVKPLLVLRQQPPPAQPRGWRETDRARAAVILIGIASLVALAGWQAGSWRIGLYVCLGFAGTALVLYLAGALLIRAVRPLAASAWFPLRHAVMNLGRPGNQTRVILLAVGLGSFFIIGVRSLQEGLLDSLAVELQADAPDMFLIDIQPDQAAGVEEFLTAATGEQAKLIPVLRARVTGVAGREVRLRDAEEVRRQGGLGREYVITYRDHLEANERIVEGRFWPASPSRRLEVSIERSLRDRFGLRVGDRIRFDVLGRVFEARITSVRQVDWDDSRSGGFMFLFRPGVLEEAPGTYIAVLKAPADPTERARLQRSLVTEFPNVSAIDVREVIAAVQQVVSGVTVAVSIVGLVALASGALILVGAVAMTKFQRVYEAAIFRTLGASTRTLAAMLALEYSALGALAGTVASAGAMVLSWAVSRHVLEIPWRATPVQNAGGLAITAGLVALVGVLASLDVLRQKPLATLRAE